MGEEEARLRDVRDARRLDHSAHDAWTDSPSHEQDLEGNRAEINRAVALAQQYPDIIKVIAVGNEAMVHWAASYFVAPEVILDWVNHLQGLKAKGVLPTDLWITSSDNFASWGGGGPEYHNADLDSLILAVDYVSMHTYPFHDTHYNPTFWKGFPRRDSASVPRTSTAPWPGRWLTAKTNTPPL